MAQPDRATRQPLVGLRVIDFGQYISGPLAAMLLADFGAEIIRVDPPHGPFWKSPANATLQRGKRSITLDLKTPHDRDTALSLIGSADIVIENFRPGVMDRLGLGARAMTAQFPQLIYCSIPGFGEDDPRAGRQGWEQIVAAASGLSRRTTVQGVPIPDPFYSPVPFASVYGGIIAAHAIMAGLIARHRYGQGQRIEAPLFEAAYQVMNSRLQHPHETPPHSARSRRNPAFREVFLCGDGKYIFFTPPFTGHKRFIDELMPKEIQNLVSKTDPESEARMRVLLGEFFGAQPAAEWERRGQAVHAGIGVIQTRDEWLDDAHARACRAVIELRDPELGKVVQAGHGIEMDKTPPMAQSPRHRLNSDRDAILAELASRPRAASGKPPAQSGPPLQGIKVVDATQVLAGPTAARILAEYGADVIKINNPAFEKQGLTAHPTVNSGKRSLLLNLRSEEGRDIALRLIERADIFHQNFAVGVADRLGVGETQARARRGDIIYSSINTHAAGGYRGHYRGHEQNGQAVTGMALIHRDLQGPAGASWPVCDHCTGHMSAFAMLVALYHRYKTGESQHVRASLSGSGTMMMLPFLLRYEGSNISLPHGGNHDRGSGPLDRLYETTDGWVYLRATQPGDRDRLAGIEGLSGIGTSDETALGAELESRFKRESSKVWAQRCLSGGIAAEPLIGFEETSTDPIVQARGVVIVRNHRDTGDIRRVASRAKLHGTPVKEIMPAPLPGSDNQAVLTELGLGERYEALRATGVLGHIDPATEHA